MSQRNNKVAEIEAQNVRLNELNNKLFELLKSSGNFKNLEETNKTEVDAQNIVFEDNPKVPIRHGNKPKHVKEKAVSFHPKATEKCYFYENGFCRKGAQCSFNHPSTMCKSFWSHGDCGNGVQCPDRHPLQVCIKYLNNTCIQGDKCVYQHPQIAHSKPKSPGNTQPLLIILVQIPQLPPFPVFFLRPLITRLPQHTALLPTTLAGNYLSKSSSLVSVTSIIGRDRETNTATLDNSRAKGGKSREDED